MTRDRSEYPGRLLQADALRFKAERNSARRVVAEQRDELIGFYLDGRLRREDFDLLIGIVNVTDATGRIDKAAFEMRVSDLILRRPELAAPPAIVGGER